MDTFILFIITVRCGKVMFSQACAKNSVHRGSGVHPPGRHPSPTPETATAAGGTHPTGMHSCSHYEF